MQGAAPKRRKLLASERNLVTLPESMVVQFRSADLTDEPTSFSKDEVKDREVSLLPAIDLPLNSTTMQIERVLNEMLGNDEERTPYAFFVTQDRHEIVTTLAESVKEYKISTEAVLEIKYEPLSLFKVNPVTRCSDTLPGHTEALLHVRFSPDGTRLASGGGDTTVRFWNVSSRTPIHVCRGHKNHVLCTSWSPDGLLFASGDKSGMVMLWDPVTGKLSGRPLQGHRQYVSSISWEPHHLNENCERLVTGSKDKTARVWNARTGRCEMTLTGHGDSVECVKWGGEGFIYTASRDKNIMVWAKRDSSSRSGIQSQQHPFILVRILKGHGHRINSLALSTDYLNRTGAFDHTGAFYIPEEAKKELQRTKKELPQAPEMNAGKFQFDKKAAHAAAVARYEEAKAQVNRTMDSNVPFERLVSCSDDLTLYLWHPTVDKKPVQRMFGHHQPVAHIAFSPDGRHFASASFDRKVKLWCGRTGRFLSTLNGHVARVYQICWAPDSRYLCSASKDSTIKVWSVRGAKKPKETLSGHWDEVYALDWSPNGELLASGGKDRVLKIWTS